MRIPAWVYLDVNKTERERKLHEALAIAWEALGRPKKWNDVKGLTAEAALRESIIDMQDAIRRIKELA